MDENFMQDNLPLFIGVFATVCIVIVVLMIVSGRKQKAKKKTLLSSNSDLVEVEFDYPAVPRERVIMNPGTTEYVLHSVNGKAADLISRSVLVPAGKLDLDIEFYQLSMGKKIAKSLARSETTFMIEKGKKYQITYNYLDKIFECKEIKK